MLELYKICQKEIITYLCQPHKLDVFTKFVNKHLIWRYEIYKIKPNHETEQITKQLLKLCIIHNSLDHTKSICNLIKNFPNNVLSEIYKFAFVYRKPKNITLFEQEFKINNDNFYVYSGKKCLFCSCLNYHKLFLGISQINLVKFLLKNHSPSFTQNCNQCFQTFWLNLTPIQQNYPNREINNLTYIVWSSFNNYHKTPINMLRDDIKFVLEQEIETRKQVCQHISDTFNTTVYINKDCQSIIKSFIL